MSPSSSDHIVDDMTGRCTCGFAAGRAFEITFPEPGVRAYAFTFG